MATKLNPDHLYIISDHSIVLYTFAQLPAINKYLNWRCIGHCGGKKIMLSGKTKGREGVICNILMNYAQSVGLKARDVVLTW